MTLQEKREYLLDLLAQDDNFRKLVLKIIADTIEVVPEPRIDYLISIIEN